VIAPVDELIVNADVFFAAHTLEYLCRGGRPSAPRAFAGSPLNVKPILRAWDDQAVQIGRERSHHKATAHMLHWMEDEVGTGAEVCVAIMHALGDEIASRLLCGELYILDYLGPLIGVHLGPGTLGTSFYAA